MAEDDGYLRRWKVVKPGVIDYVLEAAGAHMAVTVGGIIEIHVQPAAVTLGFYAMETGERAFNAEHVHVIEPLGNRAGAPMYFHGINRRASDDRRVNPHLIPWYAWAQTNAVQVMEIFPSFDAGVMWLAQAVDEQLDRWGRSPQLTRAHYSAQPGGAWAHTAEIKLGAVRQELKGGH